MFNDRISDLVRKPGQATNKMSFQQDLAAGTLAGLFQMSITYPLETVRTRLTLDKQLAGGVAYRGIGHCFVHTVKIEGITALYKVKVVPSHVPCFPCFTRCYFRALVLRH